VRLLSGAAKRSVVAALCLAASLATSGARAAAGEAPAAHPLFRATECRGGCVEIVLDAPEDHPFTRRYVESIGRRIVMNVVFPFETVEKGAEGEVEITATIDRKGTLATREITRGSGKPLLDNAATGSLAASAPFNAFPPSPFVKSLKVTARFRYFH
jgi:TonB family protein